MRRLAILSLTFLLAGTAQATAVRTGLYGVVTRGPISPACVAGQPCTEPAVGVRLTFSRGVVVAHVRTGAHGAYRIQLPPGRYSVRGPSGLEPVAVTVRSARFRRIDFSIDTGIR